MLTANYEYSRSNGENLPLTIQIQLSENLKNFCRNFIAFLKSKVIFEHLKKKKKKKSLITQVFLKLLTPRDLLI